MPSRYLIEMGASVSLCPLVPTELGAAQTILVKQKQCEQICVEYEAQSHCS